MYIYLRGSWPFGPCGFGWPLTVDFGDMKEGVRCTIPGHIKTVNRPMSRND